MAQLNGQGTREASARPKPHSVTLHVPIPFECSLTEPAHRWLDGKAAPTLPKGDVPDTNNFSPTTLLNPYSLLLHPSKDGSDRLHCHRETSVPDWIRSSALRTGALYAWR